MNKEVKSRADLLFKKAEKISNGVTGHSSTQKAGYLKHASGRRRSQEAHAEIIKAYAESYALRADPLVLYRIALEYLNVDDLYRLETQLNVLDSTQTTYDTSGLWIKFYLKRGLRDKAKLKLDDLNLQNKEKGLPKQKLSDFEWM